MMAMTMTEVLETERLRPRDRGRLGVARRRVRAPRARRAGRVRSPREPGVAPHPREARLRESARRGRHGHAVDRLSRGRFRRMTPAAVDDPAPRKTCARSLT